MQCRMYVYVFDNSREIGLDGPHSSGNGLSTDYPFNQNQNDKQIAFFSLAFANETFFCFRRLSKKVFLSTIVHREYVVVEWKGREEEQKPYRPIILCHFGYI